MNTGVINRILGKERVERVFRAATLLFFLLLWFWKGVELLNDSGGYIDGAIIRSPLYPLIIRLFSLIDSSLNLLALFQLLFGLFAIHTLLNTLRKFFYFGYITSVIVFIFISLPYYFVTPNQKFLIGNSIMSGAICYPLFLMAASALCRTLTDNKLRFYIYFIIISALLVITRRQFLFMYPFFALLWLSLFIRKEKADFSRWALLGVFFISIIAADVIERTYQYVKFDEFSYAPFTGRQILVMPMFVASDSDTILFEKGSRRDIFKHIYGKMSEEEITFEHRGFTSSNLYEAYERYYNPISHRVIPAAAEKIMGKRYTEHKMDDYTVQISLTLIKKNLIRFIKLYLKNIEVNIGNKPILLFLLLIFLLSLIRFIRVRSKPALLILFALILQFGNFLLIAFAEPIIWRYTMYTNHLLYTILALSVLYKPKGLPEAEQRG